VQAFGEKMIEPLFRFWYRIRPRDAAGVEAQRLRLSDQRGFDFGGIAQKSRSA
jgi:hypothetical protein